MQICKMFVHKDRFSTGFVSTFVSYPGSCLNMFVIALSSCVVTEKHGEGACKATARSASFSIDSMRVSKTKCCKDPGK